MNALTAHASTMEIAAFITPSVQLPIIDQRIDARLPYQRIVALWHNDGDFGRHLGTIRTDVFDSRKISISRIAGERLFRAFEAPMTREPMNCHKFGRIMLGINPTTDEPVLDFSELERAKNIPAGNAAIIGAEGWGEPHTIGYGLGHESKSY